MNVGEQEEVAKVPVVEYHEDEGADVRQVSGVQWKESHL